MRKYLLFAACLALVGAGCLGSGATAIPSTGLGETFTLKTGQARSLADGLGITLEAIGDSRCKPGVQCIWAGELSPKVRVDLNGAQAQELTFGTTTRRSADALGHHFELKDATADSAAFVVTK